MHTFLFPELVTKFLTASDEDKPAIGEQLKNEISLMKKVVQEVKKYK